MGKLKNTTGHLYRDLDFMTTLTYVIGADMHSRLHMRTDARYTD